MIDFNRLIQDVPEEAKEVFRQEAQAAEDEAKQALTEGSVRLDHPEEMMRTIQELVDALFTVLFSLAEFDELSKTRMTTNLITEYALALLLGTTIGTRLPNGSEESDVVPAAELVKCLALDVNAANHKAGPQEVGRVLASKIAEVAPSIAQTYRWETKARP